MSAQMDAGPNNSPCLSKRNQVTHIHVVSAYSLLEFLTSLFLSNPYLSQLATLQTFQGCSTFRKMKVNKQIHIQSTNWYCWNIWNHKLWVAYLFIVVYSQLWVAYIFTVLGGLYILTYNWLIYSHLWVAYVFTVLGGLHIYPSRIWKFIWILL